MKLEFSAGIVPFYKRGNVIQYLLLHYSSGHWDFPKGHIEPNESKHVAAYRELQEETGITKVIIEPGFEYTFNYFFKSPKKELIKKNVYFYCARAQSKKVLLSDEHIGFTWLPLEKALEMITYDNAKELLQKINDFLLKNSV